MDKVQAIFVSHGGGPMPLLGDPDHLELVQCLKELAQSIEKPAAILLVSAHWETPIPALTAGAQPELIYDYYGFPEESYRITYPCPGHPELAGKIDALLQDQGFVVQLDQDRGFDHGMFVPMKLMYPQADIPCVQLSLLKNLNPADHLRMGSALAGLEQQGVLVIGSGYSFHNLRAFYAAPTPEIGQANRAFEQWLIETCCSVGLTEQQREQRLLEWEQAPYARFCHPREEHLLPLHVCYGKERRPCSRNIELAIGGKDASIFIW